MLLVPPLAGDGTRLHFEYTFWNTLDRVYYYCCYLFPCWLCLILYKQICNCKGISQALANVYHCATGCSVCCLTFVINIHKHILLRSNLNTFFREQVMLFRLCCCGMFRGGSVECDMQSVMLRLSFTRTSLLQLWFINRLVSCHFQSWAVILCQTRGLSSLVALLMGPLPGAWKNWNSEVLLVNPCISYHFKRPLGWQFQGGLCVYSCWQIVFSKKCLNWFWKTWWH